MLNLLALSAVLLLGAAIILLMQKWLRRKHRGARRTMGTKPKSYAAVGIRADTRACAAVQEFYGKRFLPTDAPLVPVAGCTVRPCPCRYEHFADRREEDRRVQFGFANRLRSAAGNERRRSDRRHAPTFS